MIANKEALSSIGNLKKIATARYPSAQDSTIYWGKGHALWSLSNTFPISSVTFAVVWLVQGTSDLQVN